MAVQAINGVTSATSASTVNSNNLLDKDAFMKILMSQIKYQDPLNPADASEFMVQLAQLTQVEQLKNISSSLEEMKKASENNDMINWISTIGKKMNVDSSILSKGDQVYLTPAGDYDEAVLTLADMSSGSMKEVRIKKGEPMVYTYDGENAVAMTAVALKDNKQIGCTTSAYRIVKGVDMSTNGTPLLVAGNGDTFSAKTVKQIKE